MDNSRENAERDLLTDLYIDTDSDLRQYLRSKLSSRQDADDIAQESYLRMHRSGRVSVLANPRAFLFKIASNLVIDRARKHIRQGRHKELLGKPVNVSRAEEAPCPNASPEASAAAREELFIVIDAIEALPFKCKKAFVLQRFNGLSHRQIADELLVSKSMVEKYMAQALYLLNRALP